MNVSVGRWLLRLRNLTKHSPGIRGLGKIIPPIMEAGYRLPEELRVQRVHDVDGDLTMDLDLDDMIQAYIFWSPSGYDRHAIATLKRVLKPGDVFVDLGANVGYYTLVAAKCVGPHGRVLAVEPDPENYARLGRNIELNGFAHVLPVARGVSDVHARLPLRRGQEHNRGAHTLAPAADPSSSIEVEVDTLDRIFEGANMDRVDVIKLDIQGFEVRALREASVIRYRPTLLTELAEEELALAGSSTEEYLRLLHDRGYEVHPIPRDPLNYLCIPRNGGG